MSNSSLSYFNLIINFIYFLFLLILYHKFIKKSNFGRGCNDKRNAAGYAAADVVGGQVVAGL
jgi:hypothetical protein